MYGGYFSGFRLRLIFNANFRIRKILASSPNVKNSILSISHPLCPFGITFNNFV